MKKNGSNITAEAVIELLLEKHREDVAVPECKVGPTWTRGRIPTRRFDLWVMKRSYSHPNFIGYEVKVKRSDFLRDEKWRDYLTFCSEFSFVCPPGVIEKNEVPEEAGLLVTSSNAKVILTKKKAPYRNIEAPVSLLLYVLMSRTRISNEADFEGRGNRKAFWERWLAGKEADREFGWRVSKKIREHLEKLVYKAETETKRVEAENKNLAKVAEWCKRNNVDLGSDWSLERRLVERLDEFERGYSEAVFDVLIGARRELANAEAVLRGDVSRRRRVSVEEENIPVRLGASIQLPKIKVKKQVDGSTHDEEGADDD